MDAPANQQLPASDTRSTRQSKGEGIDHLAATDTPGAPAEGARPAISLWLSDSVHGEIS